MRVGFLKNFRNQATVDCVGALSAERSEEIPVVLARSAASNFECMIKFVRANPDRIIQVDGSSIYWQVLEGLISHLP